MSPSLVAVSERLWELDPASGSVMAKAILSSPVANRGSHRCFCSSVPNLAMMVAQMAGDTTMHQQRAAGRGQLLVHGGQLGDPTAAAAVLLGHVDPEEARPRPRAFHSSSVRSSAWAFLA